MEKNKKKATPWDARVRGELRKFFEFYALLAMRFSLRLWLVRRREGRRYAPTRVTVLTALTIHLSKVETFFLAFLRVSQCAFWPKRFLCYLSLFSAIQKIFSCCFTLLLFFMLGRCQRARQATSAGALGYLNALPPSSGLPLFSASSVYATPSSLSLSHAAGQSLLGGVRMSQSGVASPVLLGAPDPLGTPPVAWHIRFVLRDLLVLPPMPTPPGYIGPILFHMVLWDPASLLVPYRPMQVLFAPAL